MSIRDNKGKRKISKLEKEDFLNIDTRPEVNIPKHALNQ